MNECSDQRFNPCCTGYSSRAKSPFENFPAPELGFNPCCTGYSSRAITSSGCTLDINVSILVVLDIAQELSPMPCVLQPFMVFQSLLYWISLKSTEDPFSAKLVLPVFQSLLYWISLKSD
ncbi:hypothetical protein THII_0577 [Thioploca ingrica]|uniref:Uncharacterized protein n=1 Tax=Thioploca ingrica TaxID=40754 RepID=A0A090ADJ3_9GAMM|nr:hypothetical protein THII_0577 [Thioploca ingrica]